MTPCYKHTQIRQATSRERLGDSTFFLNSLGPPRSGPFPPPSSATLLVGGRGAGLNFFPLVPLASFRNKANFALGHWKNVVLSTSHYQHQNSPSTIIGSRLFCNTPHAIEYDFRCFWRKKIVRERESDGLGLMGLVRPRWPS